MNRDQLNNGNHLLAADKCDSAVSHNGTSTALTMLVFLGDEITLVAVVLWINKPPAVNSNNL